MIYFVSKPAPDNVEFLPGGTDNMQNNKKISNGCFQEGYCEAWIVNMKNTDYLKTDKNGKCPNGKLLTLYNKTCNN